MPEKMETKLVHQSDDSKFDDSFAISEKSDTTFCEIYDDFDVSIPSISIPSSLANITIHKIPLNDKSMETNDISISMSNFKPEKKRGRKKKNYSVDSLSSLNLSQKINELNTSQNNFQESIICASKLAQILNGEFAGTKFKTSNNMTIEAVPKIVNSSPGAEVIVEVDPAQYFPDEPQDDPIPRRTKKQDVWDGMPYKCDICQKGFKIFKGLQLHKRSKHDIEDLSGCYPCECCIEVFWMKRDLLQHMVEHQDKNGRLPCPEGCGASEMDMPRLARHKSMFHPHLGTLGRNWFHTWCDK